MSPKPARFIAIMATLAAMISAQPSAAAEPIAQTCAVESAAARATLLEGKRFTVQVQGNGPDVILIPGLSSPRTVWDETVEALAGCYTIHSIQIRGFGDKAQINADGPVLDPFITELADYIDDEIIDKGRPAPAIVGHSLGGLSALMIGARHSQVAGKIMVIDALPFIGTIFGAADVAAIRPQAEAMAASIRGQYREAAAKPTLLDCNDPAVAAKVRSIWSNTARGRCLVDNWGKLSDPRVTAQAMLDDMLADIRPELPKIVAPVTLLYAQDDTVMPEAMARTLFEGQYAGTPKFRGVMIKGSYHFIMLDQPQQFRTALEAFLRD